MVIKIQLAKEKEKGGKWLIVLQTTIFFEIIIILSGLYKKCRTGKITKVYFYYRLAW